MPVYGNMLTAFPELMKDYQVFKMKPRIGAGYGERYDVRTVRAYWSQRRTGKTSAEDGTNVPDHKGTFWAMSHFNGKNLKMEHNDFVEISGELYRVVQDDDFSHEAGFYKCLLQVVKGITDQQVTNTKVDGVIVNDY